MTATMIVVSETEKAEMQRQYFVDVVKEVFGRGDMKIDPSAPLMNLAGQVFGFEGGRQGALALCREQFSGLKGMDFYRTKLITTLPRNAPTPAEEAAERERSITATEVKDQAELADFLWRQELGYRGRHKRLRLPPEVERQRAQEIGKRLDAAQTESNAIATKRDALQKAIYLRAFVAKFPDLARAYLSACEAKGVPFVIESLIEDAPAPKRSRATQPI